MQRRTLPPAAIAVNRPATSGPVVVSIPHAGRLYPPEILAAARVARAQLERLEDSWCDLIAAGATEAGARSEEHTSELQSLMRISYAVFCLKKKNITNKTHTHRQRIHQTHNNYKIVTPITIYSY